MSNGAPFDYYHIWLGIAPDEQPPDYYRLLGVRRFESDPVVISNAADRQMKHVKSFQNGPHFHYSQKLLNELSAARICLLNSSSKRPYDQEISGSTPKARQVPAVPIEPPPVIGPTLHFLPQFTTGRSLLKKRRSDVLLQPLALAAAGMILVIVIVWSSQRPSIKTVTSPPPVSPPTQTTLLSLPELIEIIKGSSVQIESDLGVGSGVIVDSSGTVLTNYHVVAGARNAKITMASGQQFEIQGAVAKRLDRDMALIVAKGLMDARPIQIARTFPRPGEHVLAFGSPHGLSFSASDGIVAKTWSGKEIGPLIGPNYEKLGYSPDAIWIQHTAAMSGGNSGGPLVNSSGELIGLNTFSFTVGERLNFAVCTFTVANNLLKEADRDHPVDLEALPAMRIAPAAAVEMLPVENPDEPPQAPEVTKIEVFPEDVWVDLLAQFDENKPGRIGVWEMRDDRLTLVETLGTATIELAYQIDDAFDLAVDFTVDDAPKHRLTLFLPTGSGQCVLEIATSPKPTITLRSAVAGKSKTVSIPKLLPDRPHQLVVSLRKPSDDQTSFEVAIDARAHLSWKGSTSDITVLDENTGNVRALCLSIGGSTATVHDAQLRQMSPSAPHSRTPPEGMWTPDDLRHVLP